VANQWFSQFAYDGKMRRRIRQEFTWQSSGWVQTNEVYYVYDGNVVIQERNVNSLPTTTYTRGLDLGASLQSAGGIGGLLSMTLNTAPGSSSSNSMFYHSDGNGNVTMLVNQSQYIVAKYLYDAFGNVLSAAGSLAQQNLYRFSSKEAHLNSGLIYYLYRYYDPNLQRWPNRDPLGEQGFETLARIPDSEEDDADINDYIFIDNGPTLDYDSDGLMPSGKAAGPDDRKNPHRKKRPSTHDKHTKADGRPKAGARPGKCKPNMQQNNQTQTPPIIPPIQTINPPPIIDTPPIEIPPIEIEFPIEFPIFL
jgi:RHS repeat-associated protein